MAIAQPAHRVRGGTSRTQDSQRSHFTRTLRSRIYSKNARSSGESMFQKPKLSSYTAPISIAFSACWRQPEVQFSTEPRHHHGAPQHTSRNWHARPKHPQGGIADKLRDLRRDHIDWPQNEALTAKNLLRAVDRGAALGESSSSSVCWFALRFAEGEGASRIAIARQAIALLQRNALQSRAGAASTPHGGGGLVFRLTMAEARNGRRRSVQRTSRTGLKPWRSCAGHVIARRIIARGAPV